MLAYKPMSLRVIFCLPPAKNCIEKSFFVKRFFGRAPLKKRVALSPLASTSASLRWRAQTFGSIAHATVSKCYSVLILDLYTSPQTNVSSRIFCMPLAKNCIEKRLRISTVLDTLFRLSPSELHELTFKCHGCLFAPEVLKCRFRNLQTVKKQVGNL